MLLPLLLAAVPIYERVEPVEVRTGVMRLRTVEAPLLEVPDGDASAWRETRFARLYAIEFQLETRRREAVEFEDRGALYVAVRTGLDGLSALDDRLHALLASLGADAFLSALAGIEMHNDNYFNKLAEMSDEPSWVCKRGVLERGRASATVYHRQTEKAPDGTIRVVGTGSSSLGQTESARACESLRMAAQGGSSREIRTLPTPRELLELRVEVEEANTLPRELRPEDLPPLPRGVEHSKRKAPGAWGGGSLTPDRSQGTYVEREVEWVARTAPAALWPELLARGAHVSRWSLSERQRRLGAAPRDEVRTVAMRTVAFVPIAPPLLPEESLPPTLMVELNAELLRDDVPLEFDRISKLDATVLEWALQGGGSLNPQWLRSQGWMMIVCRHDGTAWFGLPPTAVQSPVTNASLICAAMERMLP